MKKVSVVICAYNEAPRIANVLSVVENHPLLDEIIVVDDGSLDDTVRVVRKFEKVRLISFPKNRGKSQALLEGARAASGELLMLLDADLRGLSEEAISQLVLPVLEEEVDVTLSLRRNSLLIYRALGLDFVSGERVVPRALILDQLAEIDRLPGFGIEVFMNRLILEQGLRLGVVEWNEVYNPRKAEKIGFWEGRKKELDMIRQILKVVSLKEAISQNFQMISRREKVYA